MNFKHHLWPQTGESAIPSDWQVYTDTLRYLRRNFPAGTNGNKPIFSFHWMLKVVEVRTHAHPDMPSICQHYSDPCILYIFHTCFPNLTFKPYFSSIVNDDAFLYVTKSNASNTSNYITYICMYIYIFLWNRCRPNMTCGCKQPPVFPANIKEPILIFQNCVRPNPAVCHNVPY